MNFKLLRNHYFEAAPAIFCLAASLILLALPATANDFSARVIGISDGDTITVLHDGQRKKIRLNGIDCPEKSQAFGKQAKIFTANHCLGQEVTIHDYGHDKYGRTIGDVTLADGQSLNADLVRSGHAWWYRHYSKDTSLKSLEADARQSRAGLWSENPQPPWEFRKRKTHAP